MISKLFKINFYTFRLSFEYYFSLPYFKMLYKQKFLGELSIVSTILLDFSYKYQGANCIAKEINCARRKS